jgi:hypothetical protein
MQFSAIGEKYVRANPHKLAFLARVKDQSNIVAVLQCHVSPAQPDQISRIIQFDSPAYNLALVIFRVKINLAMGIGPHKLRNAALDSDPSCKVVPLRSVVCHDRATKG